MLCSLMAVSSLRETTDPIRALSAGLQMEKSSSCANSRKNAKKMSTGVDEKDAAVEVAASLLTEIKFSVSKICIFLHLS